MTHTMRLATPADGEGIATLFMRVWNSMAPMLPPGFLDKFDHAVQREKYAARAADPSFILYVAEQDGKIVGMVSAKDNKTPPLEFKKQVAAMYVDPDHQGRGIGKAMLETIKRAVKETGAPNLMLWCITHNDNACRFYETQGGRRITGLPLPEEYSAMPHVVFAWPQLA